MDHPTKKKKKVFTIQILFRLQGFCQRERGQKTKIQSQWMELKPVSYCSLQI